MLTQRPVLNFIKHYVEMVLAMLIGMAVLGGAATVLLDTSDWGTDAQLLGMAFTMTVPMVAWMRYRAHAWAPTWEMAAAMVLPTFAAMALLWGGAAEDEDTLMALEHIGMFGLMFAAMLLRRDEYAQHAH